MVEILGWPLYVFDKSQVGMTCSKLFDPDKNQWKVLKYILTDGFQCTCPSFILGGTKTCKHLRYLKNDFSDLSGASELEVATDISNIAEAVQKIFPKSAEAWQKFAEKVDGGNGRSITHVELTIMDKTRKSAEKVVSVRKVSSGEWAFVLKWKDPEEIT